MRKRLNRLLVLTAVIGGSCLAGKALATGVRNQQCSPTAGCSLACGALSGGGALKIIPRQANGCSSAVEQVCYPASSPETCGTFYVYEGAGCTGLIINSGPVQWSTCSYPMA